MPEIAEHDNLFWMDGMAAMMLRLATIDVGYRVVCEMLMFMLNGNMGVNMSGRACLFMRLSHRPIGLQICLAFVSAHDL